MRSGLLRLLRRGSAPRIAIVRHCRYPDDMHVRRDALALHDAGFDVDVICDREPNRPRIERLEGITVVRIPPQHKRGGFLRYAAEYVAFPVLATLVVGIRCMKRPYRWVEINNIPDWLIVAGLIPKLLGAKVALYSREDMARLLQTDRNLSQRHPAVRILRAIELVCCHAADRVITTQELARQDLATRGIPVTKIVAVPNAPDERSFFARLPEASLNRRKRQIGDGSFRLVTHGLLVKRYGLETLLEAVALLRDRIPDIRLEILGAGEYRPQLEALTARLTLQHCVTFTGFLKDYEDVAPRLIQADLGVVALWTDFQLCNKLVDYLALGLPVITTESAAAEAYLNRSEVCFVEPKNAIALADAILLLYLDPEGRSALAARGHAAYLEHFSWKKTKQDYIGLYGEAEEEGGVDLDSRRKVDKTQGGPLRDLFTPQRGA